MSTPDPALLLQQWLSPAFPVGAFAYSHGLETLIASGDVASADALKDWLRDICQHGGLRSDLVLLKAAYEDPENVASTDAIARAFCPSSERLKETDLQGIAFVDTVNAVWDLALPRLTYPVAVGAAAGTFQLPLALSARLYAQAFLSNLVSAAVRLVPLGQTEGQRVLASLSPAIESALKEALATPLQQLNAASFAADIASMRHETLEPRIFRT